MSKRPSLRGLAKGPTGEINAKAQQIIDAARRVFFRQGYDTSNMDQVAQEADVSKATVYAHFQSKEALLLALIQREFQSHPAQTLWGPEDEGVPVAEALHRIARRYAAKFKKHCGQELRQLVMAQIHRVPAVGRLFWESGPRAARTSMEAFLERAVARGDLAIPNLEIAATQFLNLVRGDWPLERDVYQKEPPQADIDAYVDSAVRMFLAAYAPCGPEAGGR